MLDHLKTGYETEICDLALTQFGVPEK